MNILYFLCTAMFSTVCCLVLQLRTAKDDGYGAQGHTQHSHEYSQASAKQVLRGPIGQRHGRSKFFLEVALRPKNRVSKNPCPLTAVNKSI